MNQTHAQAMIQPRSLFAVSLVLVLAALMGVSIWQGFSTNTRVSAGGPPPATGSAGTNALDSSRPVPEQAPENIIERADLSMRVAGYWTNVNNGRVRCLLCPHQCVIANGFRGRCRARMNVDGTLRTLVYGKAVAVHVDPIEKKPLFHFYPRSTAFSLAAAGCNLRCLFCQNWEISQASPESARALDLTPAQIVQAAVDSGCRSIAYTYTEPTIFFEYMRDTAKLAHEAGLENVWVTCGYIEEAPLRELCRYIDAANVDLKGFSEEFYQKYTSGSLAPVLRTFKILKEEGVWTELTNLIIPGANDDPVMITNLCAWVLENIGPDVPVHFSRFYPNYKMRDTPPTPVATISRAVAIARGMGLKYVYAGNVAGSRDESTYCPNCGARIVSRLGYMIDAVDVKDGKCSHCGTPIPGRWD